MHLFFFFIKYNIATSIPSVIGINSFNNFSAPFLLTKYECKH